MGKLFSDETEPVTRVLRYYNKYRGEIHMKTFYQIFCTRFLGKYVGIYIYNNDMKKIYIIDYEYTHFVKKYGYALIGNPEHPDGNSSNHECFIIHDDLFAGILATDHYTDISLNFVPKYVLFPLINDSSADSSSNLRKRSEFFCSVINSSEKYIKQSMPIQGNLLMVSSSS